MTHSIHRQSLSGDRDAVWYRLYQLGTRVRSPEFRGDAEAIAREVHFDPPNPAATEPRRIRFRSDLVE